MVSRSFVIVLGCIVALGMPGCRRRADGVGKLECSTGREDGARAERVIALLRTTATGGGLMQRSPQLDRICFGPAAVLEAGRGTVTLAGDEGDAESAARLGHLLLHRATGDPISEGLRRSQSCSSIVRDALMVEARAHAVELERVKTSAKPGSPGPPRG